jgi:hypothetical protein
MNSINKNSWIRIMNFSEITSSQSQFTEFSIKVVEEKRYALMLCS